MQQLVILETRFLARLFSIFCFVNQVKVTRLEIAQIATYNFPEINLRALADPYCLLIGLFPTQGLTGGAYIFLSRPESSQI